MSAGVVVLVVAVVAALAFTAVRALRDGQFRAGSRAGRATAPAGRSVEGAAATEADPAGDAPAAGARTDGVLAGTPWAGDLGERATLLQFSSSFCAPCRATRRTLEEVARVVPGVSHVEVDAEAHLDLVRELGVLRTPTTIVLDASGREVRRAQGAPSKQAVIAGLGELA